THRIKDLMPAPGFFIFGTIALLFAISDMRMIARGSLVGAQRIARHLWRMCMALLIAALSFFPGQTKIFPASVRAMPIFYLPHLLLAGSMIYWLVRTTRRKRTSAPAPAVLRQVEATK